MILSQHRKDLYQDLVLTIIPGPLSLSYFLPLVLLVTGLLIPPAALSHSQLRNIFIPVIVATTVHGWICMRGPDVISTDTLWWSLYFLAFRDPRRTFRRLVSSEERLSRESTADNARISRKSEDESPICQISDSTSPINSSVRLVKEEAYPHHIAGRLKWVFLLLSSRPLTSWMTGDPAHDSRVSPPNISRTRRAFVYSVLKIFIPTAFLVMPLALQVHAYDEACRNERSNSTHVICHSTDIFPLIAYSLNYTVLTCLLRPLTLGAYLYSLMILLFMPPYLIPVFTNYLFGLPSDSWSPHTWPRPHFGPFTSVLDLGVRGLWGKWWHQQMRHAVSEPGRQVATMLKLRRGGLARYTVICISAFLLSGITHMGLVPPEPKWAQKLGPWSLRLRIAGFFWAQPVGILTEVMLVEPAIKWLASSMKSKLKDGLRLPGGEWIAMERCLRLAWVLMWMALPLSLLLGPFSELGYWSIWTLLVPSAKLQDRLLCHRLC